MMWSKLKQTIEGRFADSLAGRVEVHSTYYRHDGPDNYGRCWLTLDKREIANWCDDTWDNVYYPKVRAIQATNNATDFRNPEQRPAYDAAYDEATRFVQGQGLYSRYEAYRVLWDSLSLSIDKMLRSENGIVRGLAMLDRRLGKRRLRALALPDDELPLVRTLYALRCEAESIAPRRAEVVVS